MNDPGGRKAVPPAGYPAAPVSLTVCLQCGERRAVVTVTVRDAALYDHAVAGRRTPSTETAAGAAEFARRRV
jgi:hypothetical protein